MSTLHTIQNELMMGRVTFPGGFRVEIWIDHNLSRHAKITTPSQNILFDSWKWSVSCKPESFKDFCFRLAVKLRDLGLVL